MEGHSFGHLAIVDSMKKVFFFFSRSACVERVDKTLRVKIRVDSFGHIAVVDSEESFVSRSACAERVTA